MVPAVSTVTIHLVETLEPTPVVVVVVVPIILQIIKEEMVDQELLLLNIKDIQERKAE